MLVNPTRQSSLSSSRAACTSSRCLASLASIISSTSIGDSGAGAPSRRLASSSRACCRERRVGAGAGAAEVELELHRGASSGRFFAVLSAAAASMARFCGTRGRGRSGAAAAVAPGTASVLAVAPAAAALLHLSRATTRPACLRLLSNSDTCVCRFSKARRAGCNVGQQALHALVDAVLGDAPLEHLVRRLCHFDVVDLYEHGGRQSSKVSLAMPRLLSTDASAGHSTLQRLCSSCRFIPLSAASTALFSLVTCILSRSAVRVAAVCSCGGTERGRGRGRTSKHSRRVSVAKNGSRDTDDTRVSEGDIRDRPSCSSSCQLSSLLFSSLLFSLMLLYFS